MKSGDKPALFTMVHPGALRFLRPWYESVRCQDCDDFKLWVGVDSLTHEEVVNAMGAEPEANWVFSLPGETGAAVRRRAMERMVESHLEVIFVDSDDVLAPSRVAAAQEGLRAADVTACRLRIIDENGEDTGFIFGPESVNEVETILPRHNIFGLSNTAYRSSMLRQCLHFPDDCVLIDWFLATTAWAKGALLSFDAVPRMFYRQYSENTARVMPPFRERDVTEATARVIKHFELVEPTLPKEKGRSLVQRMHGEVLMFQKAVSKSLEVLRRYVLELNALEPKFVWWWCVANPRLEHLWKS